MITTLYSKNKNNKIKMWSISSDLIETSKGVSIVISFGQLDGKLQEKIRIVKSGKNIGRANETSIQDQTKLEIESLIQKQLDKGYVYNIDDYIKPLTPMLAFSYKDKKHLVNFETKNYIASRKLNGIRCFIFIINGLVTKFESRSGKPFKYFTHLAEEVKDKFLDKSIILDGELFHPNIKFETICSLVNSEEYTEILEQNTNIIWKTSDIQFHCYDLIDLETLNQTYSDRFLNNSEIISKDHFKAIESSSVNSEEEMIGLAKEWIKEGYEGLMLRSRVGLYSFGERSSELLKYKEMLDSEFLILDIIDSENEPGQPKFVIQVKDDIKCEVRLKGSKTDNVEYLINKNKYIGKYITVQYQELTSYGNLSFPVGIQIREGTLINETFIPDL